GGACAAGVGGLALLAFVRGRYRAQPAFLPYSPAMRPNTALCLVLLAISLLLLRIRPPGSRGARIALACAGLSTLVALLTLAEYLLGTPFGIDELLVQVPRARMSPITACALASVGCVLGLSAWGRGPVTLHQALLTGTGVLSLLPIMGYLYNAPFLYSPGALTAVAPGTGFGLLCLAIAGFALREDEGLWPLLTGDTAGSTLLRRALPLVVLLPVGFGWLRLEAERLGNIGHELGVALIAITTVLTFAALLVWWARGLRHQDRARRLATVKLREARDTLEVRVQERTRELSQSEAELRGTARDLLAAKELAERTMQARTDFLARVSHEIRTPLNGVVGMLEIALRSDLTPAQRGYVQTARSSATALLALISDVLDFAKVDAGKLLIESTHFRLRDCVALALRDSAPAAHQKGLELYLSVEPGVPDGLIGDGQRLRQVLTNLVSNAVKFTQRG
ncbi:MAG TPA: histidine kinase dimerization/phospho-acceptor domain-containing protein, partial [Polyangiales bacterium]